MRKFHILVERIMEFEPMDYHITQKVYKLAASLASVGTYLNELMWAHAFQ